MAPVLSLTNCQRTRRVNLRLLRLIAEATLEDVLGVRGYHLGICLVAAPEMTSLNETFVHHAGSTDVITFNYADKPKEARGLLNRFAPKETIVRHGQCIRDTLHGEIFICVDEAVAQVRRFRTTWQSELVRYLIHGILHLLGYDDRRPSERRQMKRAEDRLLRAVAVRFPLSKLAVKPRLPS